MDRPFVQAPDIVRMHSRKMECQPNTARREVSRLARHSAGKTRDCAGQ